MMGLGGGSFGCYWQLQTGLCHSIIRLWIFIARVSILEVTDQSAFKLTWRRSRIFLVCGFLLTVLMIWNHIGFFLDDILFPTWHLTPVKTPLFVVGNARSGTTWLHRLITRETKRFTTMTTWEIIFAPSVTWRVLFVYLQYLDGLLLLGIGGKILHWLENRFLGDPTTRTNSVHQVGLFEAEEDEWVMMHVGYSQLVLFLFPLGSALQRQLIHFDHPTAAAPTPAEGCGGLSETTKAVIFGYYKQCVQRHLYYHSHLRGKRGLIFVSKNPTFTLRIPSIYKTFPDARVVCLLRDPLQSVPSMISYVSQVWRVFADPVRRYPSAPQLLSFCVAHYLFPLQHLRAPSRDSSSHDNSSSSNDRGTDQIVEEEGGMDEGECEGNGVGMTATRRRKNVEVNANSQSMPFVAVASGSAHIDPTAEPASGASSTVGAEGAEGRDERQWAFVSYHHLKENLEDTVLHLLQRLYGRNWYCSCRSPCKSHVNSHGPSHSPNCKISSISGGTQDGASGEDRRCVWSVAEENRASGFDVEKEKEKEDEDEDEECHCAGNWDSFRAALHCEQIKTASFVPRHQYSVEQCCGGMTTAELKEILKDVYVAHAHAFEEM